VLRFGIFEFDRRERELRKRGSRIRLQGQHYEVLSVLLEEPGRLVTREDMRRRVWRDGRFVEFDQAINKAICGLRRILGDSAVSPRFIDTVPGQGYRFVAPVQGWGSSAATGVPFPGLVVLPIENLSGDSGQEYIADAVTDILVSALGQIGRLRVISRTTAMSYKGVRKPLPQVAGELGVRFAVEGSLTRSGSRIRISLRLHEAGSDRQLWNGSYEGRISGLSALQNEAAQGARNAVQSHFMTSSAPLVIFDVAGHPEAHDAYLRGRHLWNRRTGKDLLRSLDLYRRAIELDPHLAVAHTGLADSLVLVGLWGMRPPDEVFPEARSAAVRALAIDETLAEAHTALAEVRKDHDRDWEGAERGYRRAIALHPAYATAHHWYAQLLSMLGRHSEAIAEILEAQRLEPLSVPINAFVPYIYLVARQYDHAVAAADRAIELEPRSALAHWYLGRTYTFQEKWSDAIDALQQGASLSGDLALSKGDLALALRRAGQKARAESVLQILQQTSVKQYVSPCHMGKAHLGAGNQEAALVWQERAANEGIPLALGLADPEFDELRRQAGFRELCARLNVPAVCPYVGRVSTG
jgi:TolB-like protein/tetratricopeptide (TPR) repeat protein